MAVKTAAVKIYTQTGRAPADFLATGKSSGIWSNSRPAFEEYPQTGQPPLKSASSPAKSQAGQRTEAKVLPHAGQLLAFLATSVPQLSQKKCGLAPSFDLIPIHSNLSVFPG